MFYLYQFLSRSLIPDYIATCITCEVFKKVQITRGVWVKILSCILEGTNMLLQVFVYVHWCEISW